jgi:hypothetical protein
MAHSKREERYEQIVRDYFLALRTPEVIRAQRFAHADLHFGPAHNDLSEEDCEGLTFESATTTLRMWFREQPHQIWLDTQCEEVCDKEPEGYDDEETGEYVGPSWEDFYVYEYADIKRIVFGKELAQHV